MKVSCDVGEKLVKNKSTKENNIQVFQLVKGNENVNSIDNLKIYFIRRENKSNSKCNFIFKISDRVVSLITNHQEPSKWTQSFLHGNSVNAL